MEQNNNKPLFDEQDKKVLKAAGGIGITWAIILALIFIVPLVIFTVLFFVVFNKIDKMANDQISNNNQSNVQEETKTSYVGKYVYTHKECTNGNNCKNVESVFEILDDKNATFTGPEIGEAYSYKGTYKVEDETLYFYAIEEVDEEGNSTKREKNEVYDPEKDSIMAFRVDENDLIFGMDPPAELFEKQ